MQVPAFVGRDHEFTRVRRTLTQAATGQGGLVVVQGPPGVGKSRLIAQALADDLPTDLDIALAAAYPEEQTRPFGVIEEALQITPNSPDGATRVLAGQLRSHPAWSGALEDTPVAVHQLVELVLDHVESRSGRGPMVLVIEDVHWADCSTLAFLRRLVRVVHQSQILVVLSCRPSERADVVSLVDLAATRGATAIDLEGLPVAACEVLASGLLGGPLGPRLRAEVARGGGNALVVVELARALTLGNALISSPDGMLELAEQGPSQVIAGSVLQRMRLLSDEAGRVLRMAAVLGSSFTPEDLALASDVSLPDLAEALRAAVQADLLVDTGSALTFRHGLIRDALYAEWPAAVRTTLHRSLANRLMAAEAADFRVVPHLLAGAQRGDGEAASWLHSVGLRMATVAPDAAVELLSKALAVTPARGRDRDQLRIDLSVVLEWAGRGAAGEELAAEVIAEALDSDSRGRAAFWLGSTLLRRGQAAQAAHVVGQALAAGGIDQRTEMTRLRVLLVTARLAQGDYAASADLEPAIAAAREGDDPVTLAQCLVGMTITSAYQGDLERAAETGAEAVALAETLDPSTMLALSAHIVQATFVEGEVHCGTALETLRRAQRKARQLPRSSTLVGYDIAAAHLLMQVGEWDQALLELDTALDGGDEAGRESWVFARSIRAQLHALRGDLPLAQAEVAEAMAAVAAGAALWHPAALALATHAVADLGGHPEQALDGIAQWWQRLSIMPRALPVLGPPYVRSLLKTGPTGPGNEPAAGVVSRLEDLAAAVPAGQLAHAAALLARGLVERDERSLREAVRRYRLGGRVIDAARASEDLAELLAAAGDLDSARDVLTEALDVYDQVGAGSLSASATSRLRALGVRVRRPGAEPVAGPTLTEAEQRVTSLVIEHLTNAEIAARLLISRRTVETHVSHAMAKLGCTSRRELARRVLTTRVAREGAR